MLLNCNIWLILGITSPTKSWTILAVFLSQLFVDSSLRASKHTVLSSPRFVAKILANLCPMFNWWSNNRRTLQICVFVLQSKQKEGVEMVNSHPPLMAQRWNSLDISELYPDKYVVLTNLEGLGAEVLTGEVVFVSDDLLEASEFANNLFKPSAVIDGVDLQSPRLGGIR
jgi:hypothetical protein